ncbi:MAG: creatininase family protein [Eubacteriales bacterium]|nr:creatininase family protein [Eubacteriales bacterium]
MEYRIKNLSWTEFMERKDENKTVIIPTGAVEIYGPHLPMGSDGIVAHAIAEKVAERMNLLIAPSIDMADSSALLDIPGTFTLSKELYLMWLDELMQNLVGYGFEKFLFITGHASTCDSVAYIAREYQLENAIKWAQVDWWRFAAAHSEDILEEKGRMAHGHASECGTSVMLYLRPDLVNMDKAERVEPDEKLYAFPDIQRFVPISDKTPNAIVGDASKGTAEKGEKIVKKSVDRIVEFLTKEWGLKEIGKEV